LDSLRVNHYLTALDKLIAERDKRFPKALPDFKHLQPSHFFEKDAEDAVGRLSRKYLDHLKPDEAVTKWRIFRHKPQFEGKTRSVIYYIAPELYQSLKVLHQIILRLQVTTSSLERGFSKIPLLKGRLRSTMAQDRLESLMLAAIKNITNDFDDLVAKFAKKNLRMMLG